MTRIALLCLVLAAPAAWGCGGKGGKDKVDGGMDVAETDGVAETEAGVDAVDGELAADVPVDQPREQVADAREVGPDVPAEVVPDAETEGDVETDGSEPPAWSCAARWECVVDADCSFSDAACGEQCAGELSAPEQAEWEAVLACAEKNCSGTVPPEEYDCVGTKCPTEVVSCLGGTGEKGCREVLDCVVACPDDYCSQACLDDASPEAAALLAELFSTQGPQGLVTVIECVQPDGTGTCGETLLCALPCFDQEDGMGGGMGCMLPCLEGASEEAAEGFAGILQCGDSPCFDKMVECVGGQGDKSCAQALQ